MILGFDKSGRLATVRGQRPAYKRRPAGCMNATEAAFAAYLDLLYKCGKIGHYSGFEPLTLVSGRRKYTPDFRVVMNDGTVRMYDCKGCRLTRTKRIPRPHVEPQDRLRIELFARAYPQYRFVLVYRFRDQWIEQEIVP